MSVPLHECVGGHVFVFGGIDFASFYDSSIGFWNCSESVVIFCFWLISLLILKTHTQWYEKYRVYFFLGNIVLELGLLCLMLLSTIFQLHRGVSFIVGGHRSTRRKPPTCRKSLTNFFIYYYIKYTLPWSGFELTTLMVIGSDCMGSCKSNYHTITITATPVIKWGSSRIKILYYRIRFIVLLQQV